MPTQSPLTEWDSDKKVQNHWILMYILQCLYCTLSSLAFQLQKSLKAMCANCTYIDKVYTGIHMHVQSSKYINNCATLALRCIEMFYSTIYRPAIVR